MPKTTNRNIKDMLSDVDQSPNIRKVCDGAVLISEN